MNNTLITQSLERSPRDYLVTLHCLYGEWNGYKKMDGYSEIKILLQKSIRYSHNQENYLISSLYMWNWGYCNAWIRFRTPSQKRLPK